MRPKVAFLTMEMLMPHLEEPYRGANFKGGLGKLAGCFMGGMPDADIDCVGFVPLYRIAWFNKDIALDYSGILTAPAQIFRAHFEGRGYPVNVWKLDRGKQPIFGLESPEVFDILYVEDRKKRLIQEAVFAQVVPQVLRRIGFKPDVLWLNESHTALTIPHIKTDWFFAGTKVLFTIHTPEQAGMEKFYDHRVDSLCLPQEYVGAFVDNGVIDLTRAAMHLADKVNAVSREHGDVTRRMFPEFMDKITHVTNGTDQQFWRHPEITGAADAAGSLMELHRTVREESLALVNNYNRKMNCGAVDLLPSRPTAWFVRRFAAYKNLFPFLVDILPAVCAERGMVVRTKLGELPGLGMQVVGAGRAAETDNECLYWMSEFTRMTRNGLTGKFLFFPEYNLELLCAGIRGADIWLVTPKPGREACGTSDRDAAANGIPSVASRTGGMMEWMEEFDPLTRTGNGFFIEPYNPRTLFEKLKIFSGLWYAWMEHGDTAYPALVANVFAESSKLDIRPALAKYRALFVELMK